MQRVLGRGTPVWASQSSLCCASSARLGQTGDLCLPTAPRPGRTQRLPDMADSTHFQPPSLLGHVRTLLPWLSDLPPPPTAHVFCCYHSSAVQTGCAKKLLLTQTGWALSAKNVLAERFCFCLTRQGKKKNQEDAAQHMGLVGKGGD